MDADRQPAGARYEALIQLLRTADTIWNASRSFFAPWDLSPSQFNVLNLLHNRDGLSQTELSRELIMHRSNVTGLVDRLEQRGLVKRLAVAGDRRAYHLALTRQGCKMLNEILPRYHDGAEALWGDLDGRHLVKLISALRQAAQNAERIAAEYQTKGSS